MRPADSDPNYTLKCDEPVKRLVRESGSCDGDERYRGIIALRLLKSSVLVIVGISWLQYFDYFFGAHGSIHSNIA